MTEAWFHQFATCLEQLERLVLKRTVPVSELLSVAADAVNALADSRRDLQLWLVRPDTMERVANDGRAHDVAAAERSHMLQAVETGSAFRKIADTAGTTPAGSDRDAVSADDAVSAGDTFSAGDAVGVAHGAGSRRLCVASPLADDLHCVLSVQVDKLRVPEPSFVQAARAVADVVASWLSHHLLSQSEVRLRAQAELLAFSQRLQACESLLQTADIVAQDAPVVLGECRASVWRPVGASYQLLAVTGVRQPETASETVRSLQILAANHQATSDPATSHANKHVAADALPTDGLSDIHDHWQSVSPAEGVPASEWSNAIASLRRSGTTAYRILVLSAASAATAATADRQPAAADANAAARGPVVILERFHNAGPPDESLLQQWCHIAAPVLRRYVQPPPTGMASWFTKRRRRIAVLTACAIALAIVPTNFEVEVPGRIMAANQRNIFAPDSGTIDEVLFQNERPVREGQILVKMTNPDLQLEVQRIQGEVDTTLARLATARAGRLTTPDPRFSSDEQQLEVQLRSLNQQLQLVQQQTAALLIAAPVSGMAFRRDPERNLLARPVQRGQRLLEIVPDSAAWELHLEIPARLLSYVTQHNRERQLSDQSGARVRYLIRSAPQRDWTTQLATVEQAVQSENGQLVCRATAAVQELPATDLRPGTSVTARISCGRRSVGFVLFREILDFWRQVQFAWF